MGSSDFNSRVKCFTRVKRFTSNCMSSNFELESYKYFKFLRAPYESIIETICLLCSNDEGKNFIFLALPNHKFFGKHGLD